MFIKKRKYLDELAALTYERNNALRESQISTATLLIVDDELRARYPDVSYIAVTVRDGLKSVLS
jgi:hypothetical protein